MHYVDEGAGEVILFIHGTPTWSFLYRDYVRELSQNHRCIAIDHLGFGLSGLPGNDLGRPEDHAVNLSEFIVKLNLTAITLVVHDFGGPIGLSAGIAHADRIKQIVLFNTWLWATNQEKSVQKIDQTVNSWLGRVLYLSLNLSPKVLLKQGFSDKKKLSKHVHKHYVKPFPSKESRWPLLRIAQALAGSSDWYKHLWDQLDKLEGKKWLILWGTKDKFLKTNYLQKWRDRLPDSACKEFDCGHFVQEECTKESIAEIAQFMKS